MKKLQLTFAFFLAFIALSISQTEPVFWQFEAEKIDQKNYELTFTAHIEPEWFLYSQWTGEGGPVPTEFHINMQEGLLPSGKVREEGELIKKVDKLFEVEVSKFANIVQFKQGIEIEPGVTSVNGYVRFMTCNGEICMPPKNVKFDISLEDKGQ